jgi:uncharacterized protein YndB with AHSA1/START domain
MSNSPSLDVSKVIAAPAGRVLKAFFDADALSAWWQVSHSVTIPRALGPYVIEWVPTDFRDEILGRLGGVFRGTVVQFHAAQGFFVADAFWLPPDGDPIGPMALAISCRMSGPVCRLHVRQTGFEDTPRWRRYYAVIASGWRSSLAALKEYVENAP